MRNEPSEEAYRAYQQNYDLTNAKTTLGGFFLQKSHQLLERSLPVKTSRPHIIEVGAGTGHHFPYVDRSFSRYVATDGSDEMLRIARENLGAELAAGDLVLEKQNATNLTYGDNTFDRLIATHVLEHLPRPAEVLREWNRVVRKGGLISLVLPCDPGLLWRFGRHLGPRRNAMRAGVAYDYLMATEHINAIFNLVVLIRHHFEHVQEAWYPARLPFPDINLFYICHIEKS